MVNKILYEEFTLSKVLLFQIGIRYNSIIRIKNFTFEFLIIDLCNKLFLTILF